jgi:hypothetical protein
MPTAKKSSKAKNKTKPKAKTAKAVAKMQPRAAAKRRAAAKARTSPAKSASKAKAAPKARAKAAPKTKAKAAPKARAKAAPKTKAKAAPKTKATSAAKTKASAKPAIAKPRSTPTRPRKPAPRRDGTGHLNPKYARDLRALSRENQEGGGDRAFFKTPRSVDDLAEELGEGAVETMTSGEDQSEHSIAEVDEERGGPFVKTRADDEFAAGTDQSNPRDATREPFPRT